MHKGFTQSTLGLLAAALLSSSAFAAGPDINQLPNVYITDLTASPGAVPDTGDGVTPATNVYRFTDAFQLADYVTYDDENPLTTDDLDVVKWHFQEYAWNNVAAGQALTGSARTIAIGEDTSSAQLGINLATEATHTDVTGSTLPNVGVLANGLDFWNQALSPSLSANGSAPAGNFAASVDAAVIELFVAVSAAPTSLPSSLFTVYTTNDDATADGDQLASGSSSIWIPELCVDSFGGWQSERFQNAPDPAGNQTPNPASGVLTQSVTDGHPFFDLGEVLLTAPSTSALYVETIANQAAATPFQYVSWKSLRRDIPGMTSVPVPADDTLMMVRWTISADAATQTAAATSRRAASVQTPQIRLRTGEGSTLGNGQNQDYWGPVGLNAIVEANQEVRSYFYAKEGGNYDSVEGLADFGLGDPNGVTSAAWGADDDAPVVMGMFFDILDTVTSADAFASSVGGQRLYGMTLSQIEVYSTTRDQLSGEQVVFNQGVLSFSTAAGEPAPPATGYAQFNLDWWDSRAEGNAAQVVMTPANEDTIGVGSTNSPLTIGFNAGGQFALGNWDTRDYAAGTFFSADGQGVGDEVVDIDNDRLIAIDVWLSSPQGSTPNNLVPGVIENGESAIRLGFTTEIWGGTGPSSEFGEDDPAMPGTNNVWRQGRSGLFHFSGTNRTGQYDTAYVMPPTYALGTAARKITAFYEPQCIDDLDGIDSLSLRPVIQAYVIPSVASGSGVPSINSTIQIQRVVISTYDLDLPTSAICP